MSNIAQPSDRGVHLRKAGVKVKLWPNGELSIYREKRLKEAPLVENPSLDTSCLEQCLIRAYGVAGALDALLSLGLSPHRNFDIPSKPRPQYGLKGISGKGKRRVRNAAYLLTRENGKHRLTFATVTLPDMAYGNLDKIHRCWHEVIEYYRREVSRHLKRGGLSGEIISVTEVQEKRYEDAGLPVLHAHFLFVGATPNGGWVLSPSRHDHIWRKALLSVCDVGRLDVSAACQLKGVDKSAEGYLGKYMSKGVGVVQKMIDSGWAEWIPKQWWSCSRSIVRRMEKQMKIFDHGVDWLLDSADKPDGDMFLFWRQVTIERDDGSTYSVASYGRLTKTANGLVRKVLDLNSEKEYPKTVDEIVRNVKAA